MPKTATHAESQTNIEMQCVHQATMSKMANITLARRLIELITAALTTNYRSHIIVRKDDHTYYISLHWIIQFRTTITAAQSRKSGSKSRERIYTVSQKKQDTKLLAITSLTIIRFLQFFH